MGSIGNISTALAEFAGGSTWTLVGAFAAVGTITMAVLQIIKQLLPVRRHFQRRKIEAWIQSDAGVGPEKTMRTLVDLATGGEDDALFNLPIEQLIAQINAAGQIALDYPATYETLLRALCAGAEKTDIDKVVDGLPATSSPTYTVDQQAYLDARNRVSHRMQRNLDGQQIAIGDRWQFWLQLWSIIASVAIVELATKLSGSADSMDYLVAVPIGIVGGYLAPVTRDLVAALEQLRK